MIPTVSATHCPMMTVRWTRETQGAGAACIRAGYLRTP
jgi:hypothetical protein